MAECVVSTLAPREQAVAADRTVNWASFYDFAMGEIPRDVTELDALRAYTRADAFTRCGDRGSADYHLFRHKDGGTISESELASVCRRTTRETWLLSDEDRARNEAIVQAGTYEKLAELLLNGVKASHDTPEIFAAQQGHAKKLLSLDQSIRNMMADEANKTAVERMWQERQDLMQHAHLARRIEAKHIQRFRGTIYVSSAYGKQPSEQEVQVKPEPRTERQSVQRKIAGVLGRLCASLRW